MDKSKYTYHVRDRIIDRFKKEIDSMTDDEILEFNRACVFCLRELFSRSVHDSSIIEGITPEDVDKMLDAHRDHDCPFFRQ